MDYLTFGPYFVALVAYAASPGPLMAVLVARSLGNDWKGATVFAAGLCVGEIIAVIAVILGISALGIRIFGNAAALRRRLFGA